MTDEHKRALVLATAVWLQIQANAAELQAAVLRGASGDEVALLRQRGHDLLDSHLDLNEVMARAARNAVGI